MNRLLTPLVTEIFSLGTLLVLGTSSTSHAQDGEPLPYEATFEASNGFLPGSVNGQRGFSVERGQARVVPDEGRGDSAGLELSPSRPFGIVQLKVDPSSVLGERSPSDDHILHTEFYVRPGAVPGDEEDQFADVEGSLTGFFKVDEAGELFIYDGADSENGQGAWLPSGTKVALDESGSAADWIHLAFRQDFSRGLWDVAINGRIFRANLMMSDKAETLEAVEFIGQTCGFAQTFPLQRSQPNDHRPPAIFGGEVSAECPVEIVAVLGAIDVGDHHLGD